MTKAERTRQFIIEMAAPIFNRKGIAGTSMSDIMEATKLAKGGLYGNFESKEEICLESFKYLTDLLSAEINKSIDGKVTAKEKLFALLDFYENKLFKSNNGGCPILNFGTEADDTNPVMKQKVNEVINRFQSRISKIINKGQESGEFPKIFDAETFAIKMFTMIEGAILISKVQNSSKHMHVVTNMLKAEIEQNSK
ncbi:TetR/AcrR family transcriptional regulator [Mucilaginibacter sp. OK098]|uniref:TetR/AcrR family transcriptional regulator n=1 Tax=Mucilaginibacter sp. OK098 TaxID=1855297 RepID=UPI0009322B4D|nr:TetR/AcrR family transcriptional regulator [Mucilaginibacter sp. OK098]